MSAGTIPQLHPLPAAPRRKQLSTKDTETSSPNRDEELFDRLIAVCESAVDPLEIAATLEAEGLNDQAVRHRYGYSDVFALADEMWLSVPRRPAEPEPVPLPWGDNKFHSVLHGLLYGLPAVCFPAGVGLLAGRGTLIVLIVSMLISWSLSQGLASLGYARLGRLDPGGSLRVMRVGMVIALLVILAAMVVTASVVSARPSALLFGVGQGMYMLGASVLMVVGAERLLLLALAPGVLAGGAYLALGRPPELEHPVWWALAATPLLALVLATLRAARPAPAAGKLLVPADLRNAVPSAAFGLLAAGLLAFPVIAGMDGRGAVNTGALLATVPLSLSMGAAEWCLVWYRRRTQRLLRGTRDLRRFAWRARMVLLAAVLRYLAAAVLLIGAAVVIVAATGVVHPQWTLVPTLLAYLALGCAMFLALLLQTFRVRTVTLLACATALGVELTLRGWGVSAQIVACVGLLGFLAVYAGFLLGKAMPHAF